MNDFATIDELRSRNTTPADAAVADGHLGVPLDAFYTPRVPTEECLPSAKAFKRKMGYFDEVYCARSLTQRIDTLNGRFEPMASTSTSHGG